MTNMRYAPSEQQGVSMKLVLKLFIYPQNPIFASLMLIFKCCFEMQGCSKNEPFQNCASQRIFSLTPSYWLSCPVPKRNTLHSN